MSQHPQTYLPAPLLAAVFIQPHIVTPDIKATARMSISSTSPAWLNSLIKIESVAVSLVGHAQHCAHANQHQIQYVKLVMLASAKELQVR